MTRPARRPARTATSGDAAAAADSSGVRARASSAGSRRRRVGAASRAGVAGGERRPAARRRRASLGLALAPRGRRCRGDVAHRPGSAGQVVQPVLQDLGWRRPGRPPSAGPCRAPRRSASCRSRGDRGQPLVDVDDRHRRDPLRRAPRRRRGRRRPPARRCHAGSWADPRPPPPPRVPRPARPEPSRSRAIDRVPRQRGHRRGQHAVRVAHRNSHANAYRRPPPDARLSGASSACRRIHRFHDTA